MLNPHPRLQIPAGIGLALFDAAQAAARAAARKGRGLRRRQANRNTTLKPGNDTPLWNELVQLALPYLRERGSKTRLARLLGLERQRLQVCLKTRAACLDGERTLLFLCWLAAQQQGRELAG